MTWPVGIGGEEFIEACRWAGSTAARPEGSGCSEFFSERTSGVAKRAKFAECLAFLREGDVLAVTKPDLLARSTAELVAIEAGLTKRGIGLVILSMGGEKAGYPVWRRLITAAVQLRRKDLDCFRDAGTMDSAPDQRLDDDLV